jgi:hypothetical protein
MANFKHLKTTLTNQIYMHGEINISITQTMPATIKSRIFFVPNCYIKKINIKIYKNIILFVVLYGCGGWTGQGRGYQSPT